MHFMLKVSSSGLTGLQEAEWLSNGTAEWGVTFRADRRYI